MSSDYFVGEHFEAFIKSQIEQGRYDSASDVVCDGLRILEDREKFCAMKLADLRAEIQKGLDSGEGIPLEDAFDALLARYSDAGQEGTGLIAPAR
jgi:antitoxin ParD1/3/4